MQTHTYGERERERERERMCLKLNISTRNSIRPPSMKTPDPKFKPNLEDGIMKTTINLSSFGKGRANS